MKSHPAAELFPVLIGKEYEAFKADIEANGLLESIWTCDEMILDGRNRYRACNELDIEPTFRKYKGDSPITFACSMNVQRRQLTKSQLANIAVKLLPELMEEAKARKVKSGEQHGRGENKKVVQGSEQPIKGREPPAIEHAGNIVGVSRNTVAQAKFVSEKDPALSARIDTGEVTVTAAYESLKANTKPKKATPTQKERIAVIKAMTKEGHNTEQIAEKIGVSVKWTRKLAKENSITLADAQIRRAHKINARRVIEKTVEGLAGYALGLQTINGHLKEFNSDEAMEWAASISQSLKPIRRLQAKLLEVANGP